MATNQETAVSDESSTEHDEAMNLLDIKNILETSGNGEEPVNNIPMAQQFPAKTQVSPGKRPTESEANCSGQEVMDVLGNGKLILEVLQHGTGDNPSSGDKITVSFSMGIKNGPMVDQHDEVTFILGDGDFLQAFDLCCYLMHLGEIARITTDAEYAYRAFGRKPDIPTNATLVYEVQLVKNHGPVDYTTISLVKRLEEADKKRERGNYYYSRSEFSSAINSYSKAIWVLDTQTKSLTGSPRDLQKIIDMKVKCNNNLAACQLKGELFDAAIKSCSAVLNVQPQNVKALFRKGKCYAAMGEVSLAITTMKKALQYEPDSKIIHNELSRLTNRGKKQEARERAMYARMLGNENSKGNKKDGGWLSNWTLAAVAAGAAIAVSVGITAYRYIHL